MHFAAYLFITFIPKEISMLVELCCDHIESALVAHRCGADRIELCSSLIAGGLSPSVESMQIIKEKTQLPITVLIRPRGGNFVYTIAEKEIILSEIEAFIKAGAEGVVIGARHEDGTLDIPFMQACQNINTTAISIFHRAFDFVEDHATALDQIIELGFDRLLTSGKAVSSIDGIPILNELIQQAQGRISIMPGGGITAENIAKLITAVPAKEIHLSAKKTVFSTKENAPFNIDHYMTDELELTKMIHQIKAQS